MKVASLLGYQMRGIENWTYRNLVEGTITETESSP